jgi:copper chaperone CopZ
MPTTTIYVQEATSEGPIQSLQLLLQEINGVERAIVDVDDGEIKIDYDATMLSPFEIITLIEQHGLTVSRNHG